MSYGYGAIAKGLNKGLDNIERRKDRDSDRAWRDEQRENTRQDRGLSALKNEREMEQEDIDREYQERVRGYGLSKMENESEKAAYQKHFDDVARRFVGTDGADYQDVASLYNDSYPDGGSVELARNEDGSFTSIHTDANGQQTSQQLDKNQLFQKILAMKDPEAHMRAAVAPKKTKAVGINQRLVEEGTNKVLVDADPVAKAGSGKAAASIQLAEYLKRDPRYKHLGEGELVELAKASYSDPVSAASSLLADDREYKRADAATKERMFSDTLQMFAEARRGAYGIEGSKGPKPASGADVQLPASALRQLKPGKVTTFGNGQKWTLDDNGKPKRVDN